MNRENIEKFVAELESTDLPQTKGQLCTRPPFGPQSYCALGIGVLVAAREMNVDPSTRDSWLGLDGTESVGIDWPDAVAKFYGTYHHGWDVFSINPRIIVDGVYTSTSCANDDRNMSFWDIAQAYRATYLKDES